MDTPTLIRMGIENPGEIVRYEARHKGQRKDVLEIHYKRQKGSLRPTRRTYEFGRATRSTVADSGQPRYEQRFEISPDYLSAIAELDALLAAESGAGRIARILGQLDELQKQVEAGDNSDGLGERFDELRAELGSVKLLG